MAVSGKDDRPQLRIGDEHFPCKIYTRCCRVSKSEGGTDLPVATCIGRWVVQRRETVWGRPVGVGGRASHVKLAGPCYTRAGLDLQRAAGLADKHELLGSGNSPSASWWSRSGRGLQLAQSSI